MISSRASVAILVSVQQAGYPRPHVDGHERMGQGVVQFAGNLQAFGGDAAAPLLLAFKTLALGSRWRAARRQLVRARTSISEPDRAEHEQTAQFDTGQSTACPR